MKVTIDRFEKNYAIVELDNMQTTTIPKILVPNAKEGDIIQIEILKEETKKRHKEIESLIDKLFK